MSDRFEAIRARRRHLAVADNPRPGLDSVIVVRQMMASSSFAGPVAVSLRYVPDRHILADGTLTAYLAAVGAVDWRGLEALGAEMIGDLDSELLPRWVQLCLELAGPATHRVTYEQRRPDWQDRLLLSRIPLD